jgi:hypothetical protein
MTQPPTLDYQSPHQDPRAKERLKAVRHLLGNGIGSIILGGCCGATLGAALLKGAGEGTITSPISEALMALYPLIFLMCGIRYLIAHDKIRQPNPPWEKSVTITAWVYFSLVAGVALLGIGVGELSFIIVWLLFHGAIASSLILMIRQIKKAQAEIV